MNDGELDLLGQIAARVDALSEGRPAAQLPESPELSPELSAVVTSVNHLIANFRLLRDFSIALASGRIDNDVPPRMHLLGPLKSLQSSLKHLTWQTQEIASGNLSHHVDFLGEFSVAFNIMIDSLRQKEQAEREALEASKLASIGRLAGGVAHEINTPLQYIRGNLAFVHETMETATKLFIEARALAGQAGGVPALAEAAAAFEKRTIETDLPFLLEESASAARQSIEGVDQISGIVVSLKAFSAPGLGQESASDINQALRDTLAISRNIWKDVAEVETRFDPGLAPFVCRADEINQVFLSLIVNAAEAIGASGKPLPQRLMLETGTEGGTLVVRVADTGRGIPESIRKRIFDPFFTTKDVGEGTGLGLSICRDVVVKHGGLIEVKSTEGEGAIFTVRLPLEGAAARENAAA